jgi:hypothetical protein
LQAVDRMLQTRSITPMAELSMVEGLLRLALSTGIEASYGVRG